VQIDIYPATTLCMVQQNYAWLQQADALSMHANACTV